jgi:CBS domain-containing protein
MNQNIITLDSYASVLDAAKEMANKKVSSLVIKTSFGNVIGILTERDIVNIIANGVPPDGIIASSLMSTPVMSIHAAMTMEEAAKIMIQNKIRHLLVTKKEKGSVSESTVLGILSATDLAKYLLKQTISSSSSTTTTAATKSSTTAGNDEKNAKHAREDREQQVAITSEVWELFF